MHTVRSAPALGTIAERIHFPSNPKHPENALLNIIYLRLFHIEDVCSVIPIFHRVLCFDAICHVNLGTLAPWGLRFAFVVPFATCVTPCGTTAITQTQVAPRYACEALASGHSQMYQKIPSAKMHLPICSRNGVIFWAPKNPSSETISSNHNSNKTVLVLNLAIALFFVLLSPDRKPLSTKKEKLYVYTLCIHQQACGSERWFRNRVVVCLRTLWFRKVV